MTTRLAPRASATAAALLLAAACVTDPTVPDAPASKASSPPPPVTVAAATATATPVAEPTWETYGLHWGRAPISGPGSDDVALRSTPALAGKAKDPPASAARLWLPPGRQVTSLGDMGYRYLIEEGDCGGGSPRLQVMLDTDGDGLFDGNALGYAGPPGRGFSGCPVGEWIPEVATDDDPAWQLKLPGVSILYVPWPAVVAFVTETYPSHQVLRVQWVQDSFWRFDPLVTWVDDLYVGDVRLSSPGDLN